MTEKLFSKKVVTYLEEEWGAYVLKLEGVKRGVPDLVVCLKGSFYAFELKLGNAYKIQPHQILQIKKIRESGGKAFCLTYSEDWKEELHKMITYVNYEQEFEETNWD